jgi:dipeptidyl aminopeptidase/acylaminoacyl peptidase
VAASGGEPVGVTKPGDRNSHRLPSFLPDGRHFLFANIGPTGIEVFAGALDSMESTRLLAADSNALYSEPDELLFVRQGTLLRQSFDVASMEVSGDPTPVAEQVAIGTNTGGAFSVSENGVLVYRSGASTTGIVQLGWFDRSGKLLETVGPPGMYRGVELSPDGRRVAVHRHDGTGGDLWLLDLERRGTLSRLTFDASQDNASPIWSPDGRRIVFGSERNGKWGVYEKSANGTGTEQLLVESDLPKMPMAWSRDGKSVVYWVQDPKTGGDQWVLPLGAEKKPLPLLQTQFQEGHPQIAPNGKWIAYQSNESGRAEIYVRPFPGGDGKWQVSTAGGTFMRWRADSAELFYLTAGSLGKLMSVNVNTAGPTFEYGDPIELFDSGYINFQHGLNYHTYAVSPDGQRFLIPRPESALEGDAPPAPITVVTNWTRAFPR